MTLVYYHVKGLIAEMKWKGKSKRSNILTVEDIYSELESNFLFSSLAEKQLCITRIITLFLEGSCFSNFVVNDSDSGVVKRGFAPGENSIVFLGQELSVFFPYFYAFYDKIEKFDSSKYEAFVNWLRALFEKMSIMGQQISEEGFDFYTKYFNDTPERVDEKVANSFFIVREYLEGQSVQYDYEFRLVRSWNI